MADTQRQQAEGLCATHVVVPPGDEVEVVVVHEIGGVEDAQRGGGDAPTHRRTSDGSVAHGVQHLGERDGSIKQAVREWLFLFKV